MDFDIYDGPEVIIHNVVMEVSDSTILKLKLTAKTQLMLANKDREFPDGVFIKFYNDIGQVNSTLRADHEYYFEKEKYYKAEGNVIMKSLANGDELSTELLNWVPEDERIYTDNFVTIKTDDEVMTGEGLEAKEDFEEYTILKPSGTMTLIPVATAPPKRNVR